MMISMGRNSFRKTGNIRKIEPAGQQQVASASCIRRQFENAGAQFHLWRLRNDGWNICDGGKSRYRQKRARQPGNSFFIVTFSISIPKRALQKVGA
jgi:hypothetical protein